MTSGTNSLEVTQGDPDEQTDPGAQASTPVSAVRQLLAAAAGIAVMLLANAVAVSVLRHASMGDAGADATSGYDSFYDASAALFTLAVPSFLGGLTIGAIGRSAASRTAMAAFGLSTVVGLIRPVAFWQIPSVSPLSMHNGAVYYMLHNPLVMLAFGVTGAWLAGEFAVGRFTLADRVPVNVPGSDD